MYCGKNSPITIVIPQTKFPVYIIQCLALSASDHVTDRVEVNIIMIMLTSMWPKVTRYVSAQKYIYYVMSVCLYVCLKKVVYLRALTIPVPMLDIFASGSRYKGVQNMQATLQRAARLPAAPCGTDGGSCHFHCTVPAALCCAGVCLCLFLLLNVFYLPIFAKLGLVVGMTNKCQMVRR